MFSIKFRSEEWAVQQDCANDGAEVAAEHCLTGNIKDPKTKKMT